MFGGILWVLAIVAIWATIFILSITFGREMARSHDREMALLLAQEMQDDAAATEAVSGALAKTS